MASYPSRRKTLTDSILQDSHVKSLGGAMKGRLDIRVYTVHAGPEAWRPSKKQGKRIKAHG